MNSKIIYAALFSLFMLQACSTTKDMAGQESVFWVSGYKTEASAGAGNREVINIHRENEPDASGWENFYANIEGFEFEEGYMQKIKVREEKLDKSQVPADGSSIKYTLVEVLDKRKDIRSELQGEWTLARLNAQPLNRMVVLPTMIIDLSGGQIGGNAGCNNYSGRIRELTASEIHLGPIAMTKKMCSNKNIEPEFSDALNSVNTYQIKDGMVSFYGSNGSEVLAFIRSN